ncbi:MAG: 2-succinyl-5-enolpyruvyl-6-hydroxy-3-cyclohexene-1-carboxylic-acid synthase [Deltaproteobacteria bacterium]|nr:2-succinyl-5-enolpyruvyl-6-hydroxy-3-cyclohexene-1-carboxylic-acid synthase [Deltaproteobacteria bacterium]
MRVDANCSASSDAGANPAHLFAAALVDELARAGVREVCVCPGSRSTPLAIAAAQHPLLRCWSQIDERSAGFFALGAAKATRAPTALICTSGTAAANFYPAVIEAYHAHVPLIVLSADRPPELREWGAGQTIDQVRLYGTHVRWFAETAVPDADPQMLNYAREVGCRAVAEACGPPAGPVHLNLPFRDPLAPTSVSAESAIAATDHGSQAYTRICRGVQTPQREDVERLVELAQACERGVIACGPMDAEPELCAAIADLAATLGWPILADPTSQLRSGAHNPGAPVLGNSDLFLRGEQVTRTLEPQVVLRFGATPTSKSQRLWLEGCRPEHLILVDPEAAWNDPSHLASEILRVDPLALCDALNRCVSRSRGESPWLQKALCAERCAVDIVESLIDDEAELFEPRAIRELAEALPDAAILYVSNSMPVRDLDAFLPVSNRPLRVLANRGANGIDGMLSSALGAAASQSQPVVLLTGDLALLHDVGALQAAQRHSLNLSVIVFDNDGGGIFSYLPVADRADPEVFETYFRTPHGANLGDIVGGFGSGFERVSSWEHFRAAFKSALATPGVSVVEVPVDRDRSVAHHREIEHRVSEALARQNGDSQA